MTEKIRGCFLGWAVGDALGVPVEFLERSVLKHRPVMDMQGYGTWNQPPGTWSDDSSLAFCLAESLVQGYDLHDVAKKFIAWADHGYWGAHNICFDIGGATRMAITSLKKGESPLFSGELDEDCNGNGSLMRIAPVALYFANLSNDDLLQKVREVSAITHAHFRSVFSCFLFCKLLIELFKGTEKTIALKNIGPEVLSFSEAKKFNPTELRRFKRVLSGDIVTSDQNDVYSSGYVLHTLEAAIWCFMTTDSFKEAVLKAVNLGDDTDTTGCVTGALAGVYYGMDAIPVEWLDVLARKGDIVKLSDDFNKSLMDRSIV